VAELVVVDPTGITLCAVCRCVLEDGAVRQQGPDGDEFVCPEHACECCAEAGLSTADVSTIQYRPSINARLPWVYDCPADGCWSGDGYGRFRTFGEALAAKQRHECGGSAA